MSQFLSRFRLGAALALLLWLAGCVTGPKPGATVAVPWSALPGWPNGSAASAWPALLQSCSKLSTRDLRWRGVCDDAVRYLDPTEDEARAFFESHFQPHLQYGPDGTPDGMITGYYEPLLNGSRTRSERYRYPVYRAPEDLLTIDLGNLYPDLRKQRLRGRLQGRRVVPYYSRAQIDNGKSPLAGNELLWVDDAVALFFLQVQGSGRVRLDSGEMLYVGYADQNGHPYVAIGRILRERLEMKPEDVTLQFIRSWLETNPEEAEWLFNTNPSYVFFMLRDGSLPGPVGSLGVPLLAERAIAVDPAHVALGLPVWLDTTLPSADTPYRRLVFAQDTGGAIRGPARADLFLGYGETAEDIAGRMRQKGRLYLLLPVDVLSTAP
jgi:membrane-bound lytic murein transglycosylase A